MGGRDVPGPRAVATQKVGAPNGQPVAPDRVVAVRPRAAFALDDGASSTPVTADSTPASIPTGVTPSSPPATGFRTFDEAGLVFTYPAAWRESHFSVLSTMWHSIADLATGFDILEKRPAGATSMTVGGLPAYLEESIPVDPAVGADVSLTWTLSMPGSVDNFYTISALIRGPDVGPLKGQLRALVASLPYDPPVVPLPTARGAPETALAKALGILAKDSGTWRCFPRHAGSAQADISGFPSGPTFSVPVMRYARARSSRPPCNCGGQPSPSSWHSRTPLPALTVGSGLAGSGWDTGRRGGASVGPAAAQEG
jgi:hypothetical protein